MHGVLTVNFMDEAHLDLHKAVCRAMLELCDAVGASVMAHHPGKVPAPLAGLLPTLPQQVPQTTIDALLALRLPR